MLAAYDTVLCILKGQYAYKSKDYIDSKKYGFVSEEKCIRKDMKILKEFIFYLSNFNYACFDSICQQKLICDLRNFICCDGRGFYIIPYYKNCDINLFNDLLSDILAALEIKTC